MTTIRWTDTANDAYLDILQTTYDRSTTLALVLDEHLLKLLDRLSKFKKHCPPLEKIPGLRRCLVTQHIGLVYDVSGEELTIISVFDTRSEHPFF
jgi:plasmid stabilization system protein ParE